MAISQVDKKDFVSAQVWFKKLGAYKESHDYLNYIEQTINEEEQKRI